MEKKIKKKLFVHFAWFILSGVAVYLYNNGQTGYSGATVLVLLVLQPLLLPGWSLPFNILAGYTMGWFVGFWCSYTGWLMGTFLRFLFYQIPGMTFTPQRSSEIKEIIESRWWIVSAACVVPVFPIDWVTKAVLMPRIMSFSKFFLSVAIAAPLSRLPPCLLGKMDYSNLFSPSQWASYDIATILIYAGYFAIGFSVLYKEREYIKQIKDLSSS